MILLNLASRVRVFIWSFKYLDRSNFFYRGGLKWELDICPCNVHMHMEGVIWVSEPKNFWQVKDSFYSTIIFWIELNNHGSCSDFMTKSWKICDRILLPISIISIIFQNLKLEFLKISVFNGENKFVKPWFKMKAQIILIE